MSNKKKNQLGMNASTASARLIKDILFSKISHEKCFRCGKLMERDNFSIDHKIAWLNTENPLDLFFDLDNIAFSHLKCNVEAAKRYKKYENDEARRIARNSQESEKWHNLSVEQRKADRRARYLKYKK